MPSLTKDRSAIQIMLGKLFNQDPWVSGEEAGKGRRLTRGKIRAREHSSAHPPPQTTVPLWVLFYDSTT